MPNRWLRESARTSMNLGVVSDFAERLFWRLITTADDYGRFLACPSIVKSACFPLMDSMKVDRVERAIQELVTNHLIALYQVGDRRYGYFIKWIEHQGPPRAKTSKYPDPPCASVNICKQMQTDVTGGPKTETETETETDSQTDSLSLSSSSLNPKTDRSCNGFEKPFQEHFAKGLPHQEQEKDTCAPVEQGFEDLWNQYPMRNGKRLGKIEALRKWKRLTLDQRVQVLIAVRNYAGSKTVAEGIGIKDLHRWLTNGWTEWLEPEQPAVTNGHQARTCSKRVQIGEFLKPCGAPADPQSRTTEPRCIEHLSTRNSGATA